MEKRSGSKAIGTDEQIISGTNGWLMLVLLIAALLVGIFLVATPGMPVKIIAGGVLLSIALFFCKGLFTLEPNQAAVMIFFGNYVGTVNASGFFWVNPFYSRTKVSLRINNWNTPVLKVNDERGSPIEIAAVIAWRIHDTARAVFDVESAMNYLQIQSESAVRQVASSHAYDDAEGGATQELAYRSGCNCGGVTRIDSTTCGCGRHCDRRSQNRPSCLRAGNRQRDVAASTGGSSSNGAPKAG